jgi:cholesterol transport system auxiliary component
MMTKSSPSARHRVVSRASILRLMAVAAATLSLSACVSFGAKSPPSLLVITADAMSPAGVVKSGNAADGMIILIPDVPRKLDTNRVPVQINPGSIAYLKDAVWADKPARLMQSLLAETLSATTGRLILTEVEAGGKAGSYLSGNLSEFDIDARGNQVSVVYDAVLVARGKPLQKRRFEARENIGAIEPGSASAALNKAANKVAAEVADWVGHNP